MLAIVVEDAQSQNGKLSNLQKENFVGGSVPGVLALVLNGLTKIITVRSPR